MSLKQEEEGDGRVVLPPTVEPHRYRLSFTPDLENFIFQGVAEIEIEIVSETNTIEVHSHELALFKVVFQSQQKDSAEKSPRNINFDLEMQTVAFVFSEPLPVGPAVLTINFQGQLNNQMAGFYRSGYNSVDGERRIMGSTQFEPIDARRSFPCWDEPDRKATFEVTFVIPVDRQVISNMPEAETCTLSSGKKRVRFLESPKMSTYLLAYCVGEFDFVQDRTKGGVLIRTITPPGKTNQGKFALDVAVKCLDLYDEFFGLPYPLPKLDMIAIPEFAMGAMENWGLVTYREVDLLIDEATASSRQKQRVCTVVTHELAHQWFGNLVTMKWWDDLWLNEGFASWTQNFAADVIFPHWAMWDQFVTHEMASALRLDSMRSSHPIQVPIRHAKEVEEVFDSISYCKGGCVVRMMYAVLGHDLFQKGLQLYMDKFKYSNTVTGDLWGAWGEASGRDISSLACSWTEQMGYPLLSVSILHSSDSKLKLKMEQTYYLQDGSELTEEEKQKIWTIPVFIGSRSSSSPQLVMMKDRTMEVEVDVKSSQDWVKINFGQHVLVRVLYSEEMMKRLGDAISRKELSVPDRAGLVGDSNALAQNGALDVATFLRFLSSFSSEDDSTVWGAIGGALGKLDRIFLFGDEKLNKIFFAFASKLITPAAIKIGWEPKETDGHSGKLLRGTLISLLGRYASDPDVILQARKRFTAFLVDQDNSALPSEYKVSVFKIVLKNGGKKEFDLLMERAVTAETTAERLYCYHALGATSSLELKRQVLDFTMGDQIKLQDFFYPMGGVSDSSPEGLELGYTFFKERFGELKEKLASASPSLMDAVIFNCCTNFCTREKANDLKKFFEENPLPQSSRRISQLLEGMETDIKFFERVMGIKELSDDGFWASL